MSDPRATQSTYDATTERAPTAVNPAVITANDRVPAASSAGEREAFISGTCRGVTCHMCGKAEAVMKVGEEIAYDDPNPHRHNLTAYLCGLCADIVLHGAALRAAPAGEEEGAGVASGHCPRCGYTEADKRLHMDHHLCPADPSYRGPRS